MKLTTASLSVFDLAREWTDGRFGPIVGATEYPTVGDAWTIVVFRLARPTFGNGAWTDWDLSGAGCSMDKDEAWTRACGEAIERYAAIDHDYTDQIRWMSPTDPDSTIDAFPACATSEPCPRDLTRTRGSNTTVGHVKVAALGNEPAWVPAGYVHLNYRTEPGEAVVTHPISTGLAYHTELHTSIWRGLCEVAERDALMLAWWTQRRLDRIDVDASTDAELVERLDLLARDGAQITLFDMTTDSGILTVLAVARSPRYPHVVVGAGAGTEAATVCRKAVDEVVSVTWTLGRRPPASLSTSEGFGGVRTLPDHAQLYGTTPPVGSLDFLSPRGPATTSIEKMNENSRWTTPQSWSDLEMIGEELAQGGMDIYWTELDAPTDLFAGHVVKVIVPSMVPLSQAHGARFLDTARLQDALAGNSPNPYPHPFA